MGVPKRAMLQRTTVEGEVAPRTDIHSSPPVMGEEQRVGGGDADGDNNNSGDVHAPLASRRVVIVVAVVVPCELLGWEKRTQVDAHLGECSANHRLPAWLLLLPPEHLGVTQLVIGGRHVRGEEYATDTLGCWMVLVDAPRFCSNARCYCYHLRLA